MPATRSARGPKQTDIKTTVKVRNPRRASTTGKQKGVSPTFDEVDGPVQTATDHKKSSTNKESISSKSQPTRSVNKNGKSVFSERERRTKREVQLQAKQKEKEDGVVQVLEGKKSALPKKRKSDLEEEPITAQKRRCQTQKKVESTHDVQAIVCDSTDKFLEPGKQKGQQKQTGKSKKVSHNKQLVKAVGEPGKPDRGRSVDKHSISAGDMQLKGSSDLNKRHTSTVNMVIIKTEDSSSSDSDFEEVGTRYRTPESSFLSSTLSDSGIICSKLHVGSSDNENARGSFDRPAMGLVNDGSSCKVHSASRSKSDACYNEGDRLNSKASSRGKKRSTEGSLLSMKNSKGSGRKSGKKEPPSRTTKSNKAEKKSSNSKRRSDVLTDPKTETTTDIAKSDIMSMLMQMEGQRVKAEQAEISHLQPSTSGQPAGKKTAHKTTKRKRGATVSDSSEESDWEEVEDYKHSPVKSQIPDAPVQITIDDPGMMHNKRKKKEFDWQAYVRRKINRLAREIQTDMHKVSLLCLLAHGIQQNSVCSDATLCATALSIVPFSQLQKDVAFYDAESVMFLLKWFRSAFSLVKSSAKGMDSLISSSHLVDVIRNTNTSESRVLVMVLVAILRAMGFNVRLVMSLQPVPLKSSAAATSKLALKLQANEKAKMKKSSAKQSKPTTAGTNKSEMTKQPSKNAKQAKTMGSRGDRKRKQTKKSTRDSSSAEDSDDLDSPPRVKKRASGRPKKHVQPSASGKGRKDGCDEGYVNECGLSMSSASNFSDEEEVKKKKKIHGKGKKSAEKKAQGKVVRDEESGSDFDHSFTVRSLTVDKGGQRRNNNRKVLSSDDSPTGLQDGKDSRGRDVWLEVYLPRQSKWFSVDCFRCKVGKSYDIGDSASKPLLYVLGFENDGSVKDITAKYTPQWLSHTRKRRVDSDWWRDSLEPYATSNTQLDDQENKHIKDHLVQRPLPTNIGEFKNHPLYALQRHLLKYEAIYPESSIPLGYIRREPVYARECVHTLHSRDNWLREARVVRLGETAFKLVKSRKRWNRIGDKPEELDLELFGRWQTEDYIPPPAVNGKVPKNEYGNVEMFQPSMLPGGTVHVRVPALNRVARKLGIDVAAAMTGWDHHCGFSHPVLDGWIVCEEHKDVLLAAWEEDQEIQRQREEERREKRVLGNWTTLTRGLLIKERLKKKFNLEDKKAEPKLKTKAKGKKGEKATDVQHAWPAKQQQQKEEPVPQPSHYTVETM